MTELTLGEVIESNSAEFTARCPRERLHDPPQFGGFVKIRSAGDIGLPIASVSPTSDEVDPFVETSRPALNSTEGTLYALVVYAGTGSSDPGRKPASFELSEQELRTRHPQIFELLATDFRAAIVAHQLRGGMRFGVPPRPARLHAGVEACTPAEQLLLTEPGALLRSILALPPDLNADALLTAVIRGGYELRSARFDYLVDMGRRLTRLLSADPPRLNALLSALEPGAQDFYLNENLSPASLC